MGKTALHERKKVKNYAVLAAIIAFMAIVFYVTVIRIEAGSKASVEAGQNVEVAPQ